MLKIKIFTKGVFQREVHQPSIDSLDYTLNGYGLPERTVVDTKGELLADGITLSDGGYDEADVIERFPDVTEEVQVETGEMALDQDGHEVPVFETKTKIVTPAMVKLKPEYTLEVVDLEQDYDHLLQKCLENRMKEYPDMGTFMDAFFDADKKTIDDLKAARLAVKAKYPKPVKGQ